MGDQIRAQDHAYQANITAAGGRLMGPARNGPSLWALPDQRDSHDKVSGFAADQYAVLLRVVHVENLAIMQASKA